jgi:hypothetical protein
MTGAAVAPPWPLPHPVMNSAKMQQLSNTPERAMKPMLSCCFVIATPPLKSEKCDSIERNERL